jgi:histidine ammonia-lyase
LLSQSDQCPLAPQSFSGSLLSSGWSVGSRPSRPAARDVPQILGPVYDTIANVQNVLENEVNSVNDNPIIDHVRENVYHGGNFHGDYVSLEMDKLKIVITKLTMLAERQLNYLLNDKLNQKLPPFINLGKLKMM